MSIIDIFNRPEPRWEEYKLVAIYHNMPTISEWQRKIEEGWELIGVKDNKFFFRRVK